MRLHVGILILATAASAAWAQAPILDNTRTKLKTASEKNLPQNATTNGQGSAVKTAKPSPGPVKGAAPAASQAHPKKPGKAPIAAQKPVVKKPVEPKQPAKAVLVQPPASAEANKDADKKDQADGADLPSSMSEVSKKFVASRRDPFVSPVVTHIESTGCTTGKRCLTPNQISLKGVVRSSDGMIAVVVNTMNKAYFLRENDPIFNGYVLRITGDSIVFKENFQDNLGKPRTREVVKRISTPAV